MRRGSIHPFSEWPYNFSPDFIEGDREECSGGHCGSDSKAGGIQSKTQDIYLISGLESNPIRNLMVKLRHERSVVSLV